MNLFTGPAFLQAIVSGVLTDVFPLDLSVFLATRLSYLTVPCCFTVVVPVNHRAFSVLFAMGNTYNSESALEAFLSWPPANYINPVRRTWLPAFAIAWQALSTLLLAGRFYLRARKQAGSFGLDDLLIFFGWLFSVGVTTGVCFGSMRYGLDRHTWDLHITMYAGLALVSASIGNTSTQDTYHILDRLALSSAVHRQLHLHKAFSAVVLPPHDDGNIGSAVGVCSLGCDWLHDLLWNIRDNFHAVILPAY